MGLPPAEWRRRSGAAQRCIQHCRVPVHLVGGNLAGGASVEEVTAAYAITEEQVRACLALAAEILTDRHARSELRQLAHRFGGVGRGGPASFVSTSPVDQVSGGPGVAVFGR